MNDLLERFGSIDVYLFDQLLQGNIRPGMSILDAGCGRGRNLVHFLREGYEVAGFDADPASIGMEGRCQALGQGRFRLPDGTERFLPDDARIMAITRELGASLVDPLKTTLVQGQRAMTTWVMKKKW